MRSASLDNLRMQKTWLTIGIFDGLHLGHRKLLKRLVEGAHQDGASSVVFTFHPHPAIVLGGKQDFKCLSTPEERLAHLREMGVDIVITQPFDEAFANQAAVDFMRRLVTALGLRRLILGYDSALGRGREGDATRLAGLGRQFGYTAEVVEPLRQGNEIISSSRIRALIGEGKVAEANTMLGAPYPLTGTVVYGDGRGRHIELPTANIECPPGKLVPPGGIYATWIWVGGKRYRGATNIGTNPTFTPARKTTSIETHILDFKGSIYGQEVRLEFIDRLREEQKFNSVDTLLEQIRRDIAKTREALT